MYLSLLYVLCVFTGSIAEIMRRSINPVCWGCWQRWTVNSARQHFSSVLLTLTVWTWWLRLSLRELSVYLWLTGDLQSWKEKPLYGQLIWQHLQPKKSIILTNEVSEPPGSVCPLCLEHRRSDSESLAFVLVILSRGPLSISILFLHILVRTDKSCYYRRWSW